VNQLELTRIAETIGYPALALMFALYLAAWVQTRKAQKHQEAPRSLCNLPAATAPGVEPVVRLGGAA
jgi:hypothetical protein